MSRLDTMVGVFYCDKRGCSVRELVKDGKLPKGWTEVPIHVGPEIHHVDHYCPAHTEAK